jgi:hypothetical protein
VQRIKRHPEYFIKRVDGHNVILLNDKIYIPTTVRKEIIKWYHGTLHNPGIFRTEKTIKSHLTWPGMRTDIKQYLQKCLICSMLRGQSQFIIVIYWILYVKQGCNMIQIFESLYLVCQTGM